MPMFDFIRSDEPEEKTELQQNLDALSVEFEHFHSQPRSSHINEQAVAISLFSAVFLFVAVFLVVRYRRLILSFFHRLFDFQKISFDISFASRISLTRSGKDDDGPAETR